ncbi:MAG TPA: glutaredoxin, partial [Lysobacter sp.]|nr:glutaredoxin [Lysobacter sp.]
MTDEELEISRSTAGARFDQPSPATAPAATPAAASATASTTATSGSASAPASTTSASASRAPAEQSAATAASPEIESFVDGLLADREQPLVLFALAWCEFCWSLRKLFAALGIPYRSVDLDAPEYQNEDRGGRIRAVLAERTGQ